MKTKNVQNVRKIAVSGLLFLALILSACLYCNRTNNITQFVEYAFEEAVKKDFQNRYEAELEEFEEVIKNKMNLEKKVANRIARKYTQEKFHPSNSDICNEMLAKFHPLHPDTLNTLLQEALQKYDVEIPTGIVYRDNRQIQYSGNDSAVLQRSFIHWSKSRSLDTKNELTVQAWTNIAPGQVLRNMLADFLCVLLLIIVGTGIIFVSWEKKTSAKASLGSLLLDKETRKVTIGGKECPLRNQEFRLLLMFVEKENHILSRDEIKTALWNESLGVDNRVNNLLSTLRRALKDFPEYRITLNGENCYVFDYTS